MSAGANVYEVTIQKQLGGEFWTNVYHVRANNLTEALDHGSDIVDLLEIPRHMDTVSFDSMRVRPAGTSNQGTTVPIGSQGATPAGSSLPLYCTLRVDFPTAIGRPSRKFYRLPINESWQDNGQLVPEFFGQMQVFYSQTVTPANMPWLCDVDGQPIIDARPFRTVQMRQLRRGSKRKVIASN